MIKKNLTTVTCNRPVPTVIENCTYATPLQCFPKCRLINFPRSIWSVVGDKRKGRISLHSLAPSIAIWFGTGRGPLHRRLTVAPARPLDKTWACISHLVNLLRPRTSNNALSYVTSGGTDKRASRGCSHGPPFGAVRWVGWLVPFSATLALISGMCISPRVSESITKKEKRQRHTHNLTHKLNREATDPNRVRRDTICCWLVNSCVTDPLDLDFSQLLPWSVFGTRNSIKQNAGEQITTWTN